MGRSALLLDLMEPLRPVVDAVVLGLLDSETFSPSDFVRRDNGVCRLVPQLARTVAQRTANRLAERHVTTLPERLIGDFLFPQRRAADQRQLQSG